MKNAGECWNRLVFGENRGMSETDYQLEEYKLLREEVLHYMNKDTSLLTCLYTSVAAILFFAVERKIPEGCILTFLIIIPITSKFAYHQKQLAKISAYMSYYLEKNMDLKWETFLVKLSEYSQRPRTAKYLKFSEGLLMAIGSVLVYFYLAFEIDMWNVHRYLFFIESIILIVLFMWLWFITEQVYAIRDYRSEYKRIMKKIKF